MKILDRISIKDILDHHFGYDDYQGRWYETYSASFEGYVGVQSHPTPIGDSALDWLTLGILKEEEEWEE